MERSVLVGGLRRFLGILATLIVGTALVSLVVGLVTRSDASRALAIGYYIVGACLLIGGFFAGNRGPVRAKRGQPIPLFGSRFVRWATAEELEDAINTSAVFVSLGFALILAGVIADTV